ncbi:MAG: DNA replication/repair protein RecF [Bacillaceae bacterium G1]|nr:DNA replication/repair protein RecF [Bacillota bacterium]OJF17957.1 MAG: DNA replication/repair protein RecF [Bacillaceae bacterium G1]
MFLHQLSLENYRNYETCQLTFRRPLNIFFGQNAQGKTNLLEAILLLAVAKSHRTPHHRQLIRWNEKSARVSGRITRLGRQWELALTLSDQGKVASVNRLEQERLSDFVGHLNVVMFAPEDVNLVKEGPSARRRFLDMEIAQISPNYLYDLTRYHRLLQQRNRFLKSMEAAQQTALLDTWDEQLSQFGVKILQKRRQFIRDLQQWASSLHRQFTQGREEMVLHYQMSIPLEEQTTFQEGVAAYFEALKSGRSQDLRRGTSLFGPHRDDLRIFINGKDVQLYGSQGQQRTAALSLKLAELELIRQEVGEYPLLLLDDVLSELDPQRQADLIASIRPEVQTFITTTHLDGLEGVNIEAADVFYVERGQVTPSG